VTDAYTGLQHSVLGLSGVFAAREDQQPTPNNQYCLDNSTQAMKDAGKCTGNLSSHGDRLNYVSVASCPSGLDATCGKPLMNLNIPAYCGPGTPNTCPTR
jgi:hypothetical protein